jgi:hypothetical protein
MPRRIDPAFASSDSILFLALWFSGGAAGFASPRRCCGVSMSSAGAGAATAS